MLKTEFLNKLSEIQMACKLHHERMMYASGNLESVFPMGKKTYNNLSPEKISLTDQLIYRFSILQDELIEGLNELYKQTANLSNIWQRIKSFAEQQFHE
jgi:hypothetical protein